MSWSVEIYINGPSSVAVLAKDLCELSGLELTPTRDESGVRYTSKTKEFELILYEDHGSENDKGLNFEDYAYVIAMWRLNLANPHDAEASTLDFAWSTFSKLKESRSYALLLVKNGQQRLASYDPD